MILFYVEGEVHTHAAYLVDALLEISPIIKDWASMTEMLLSDECKIFLILEHLKKKNSNRKN